VILSESGDDFRGLTFEGGHEFCSHEVSL
jgi:hypothetical protein